MRGAMSLVFLASATLLGLIFPTLARGQEASPVPPAAPPLAVPGAPPLQGDVDGSVRLPGFCLTAEFLFLQPNREGLGLAVVSTHSNGETFRSLESLSWDGTPGLRVGGRYRFAESNIDIGATFTWFDAQTHSTVSAPDGGSLLGALATDRQARAATDATGDAGLNYAVLDLDAGWSTRLGDSLGARVFGGVRLASIDQTLSANYTGGKLGDAADFVSSPVRFWGAGLTAGAEATWNIYHGWGLYGRGRFGLISGMFISKRTEIAGGSLLDDERESFYTVVPVGELGAGIAYQSEHFFFSAGYEVTDWMDMVSGIGGPGSRGMLAPHRTGDITLEALSVRMGFTF
jgi:hypothetical protein